MSKILSPQEVKCPIWLFQNNKTGHRINKWWPHFNKKGTRKYKMGCANYMGWRYAWSSCAAWHFLDTKVLLLQIISNSNLRCWDLNPSLNVCTYTPKNVLCNNVEFRKSFEAKNSDIPFVKAQDWHFICVILPGQSPVEIGGNCSVWVAAAFSTFLSPAHLLYLLESWDGWWSRAISGLRPAPQKGHFYTNTFWEYGDRQKISIRSETFEMWHRPWQYPGLQRSDFSQQLELLGLCHRWSD